MTEGAPLYDFTRLINAVLNPPKWIYRRDLHYWRVRRAEKPTARLTPEDWDEFVADANRGALEKE